LLAAASVDRDATNSQKPVIGGIADPIMSKNVVDANYEWEIALQALEYDTLAATHSSCVSHWLV
jgi:hypothetical protein